MKQRLLGTALAGLFALAGTLAAEALGKGDKVACNWKGKGVYYTGKVGNVRGNNLYILYDDGDKENTTTARCDAVGGTVARGGLVICNWKRKGKYYRGKVASRRGSNVSIVYDDGDKENTTANFCIALTPAGGGDEESKLAQIMGADNIVDGVDEAYGEDIKNYVNNATERVYGKAASKVLAPATDGMYDALKDDLIKGIVEKGSFNKNILNDVGGKIIEKYKEKIKGMTVGPFYAYAKKNSVGRACGAIKKKLAAKAAQNNISRKLIKKYSAKIDEGCDKAFEKAKEWFEAKLKQMFDRNWPKVKKVVQNKIKKKAKQIKKAVAAAKQGGQATQSPIALDFKNASGSFCYWNIRVNTEWCMQNSRVFKIMYWNPFMERWSESRLSCKYGLDNKSTTRQRKTSPVKVMLKTKDGSVYYSNQAICPKR